MNEGPQVGFSGIPLSTRSTSNAGRTYCNFGTRPYSLSARSAKPSRLTFLTRGWLSIKNWGHCKCIGVIYMTSFATEACWRLQAESSDPSTDVVTICTDGLDQAKFALPRDPQLRTSAALILGSKSLFLVPCFGWTTMNVIELMWMRWATVVQSTYGFQLWTNQGPNTSDHGWKFMVLGHLDTAWTFLLWTILGDTTVPASSK